MKSVVLSTTEAEYMALSEVVKEECMSYSKHYYYLHEVYNNIPPYTKIVLKIGAVS